MEKTNESFLEDLEELTPKEIEDAADIATIRTCVAFSDYKELEELLSEKTPADAKRLVNEKDAFDLGAPVHVAAQKDDVRMLRLLGKYGADFNAKTETSGFTPLMVAIECESFKAFKYLLSVGVKKTIKNKKGLTAKQRLTQIIQESKDIISGNQRTVLSYKKRLKTQRKWAKILTKSNQHVKD